MKPEARALLRNQLDRQLTSLRRTPLMRPRRGWVRAIREALGMNGRQLAERIGIARSHLSQIESAEARDSVSLRTLRRVADALGCELVYAFVPRG
ncbi:MAG: helix-turn-helix domain-containing protein, partial [Myxococcota bacterium]